MRHSLVTLFQQSPHTAGTLRDRLCGALRQAIHQGALSIGQRLPSSRVLASDLGLSRMTVESAYGQLEAEGYLQRRVGQGTFVAIIIAKSPPPATAAGIPRLSQRGQQIVQTGGCRDPQQPRAFAAGSPDLRAFPLALWKQLTAQRLRLQGESLLRYGDPQGYLPLREAIAAHVNQTRGVICDARQVIVLTSSQQALQLIATLLLDSGDSVWMEEPGYTGARNAFISAGAALTPVAVDGDGLRADPSLPDPRLIYLTPSHQYPTGAALSLARRLALLALAAVCSVLIGGPGAVIFPMPVLLWLAMSFSLFSTMIAVLVYVLWCHLAIDFGLLSTTLDMKVLQNAVSMRLGIALLALGPIAVASMNYARNALLRTLEHVANHDALTHVLTRNAFMQRGERVIDQKGELVCVMMLDIDYFKSINDRFGHAGGDQALMAFTRAIAADLNVNDLFGRMGGEEFAIVSTLGQPQQGLQLAERLRQRIEAESITMPAGHPLQITVSIGMVTCPGGSGHSLADLLKLADLAVYKAKNAGRNRVATPESYPPNDPGR